MAVALHGGLLRNGANPNSEVALHFLGRQPMAAKISAAMGLSSRSGLLPHPLWISPHHIEVDR
jgi:hypothetical protein